MVSTIALISSAANCLVFPSETVTWILWGNIISHCQTKVLYCFRISNPFQGAFPLSVFHYWKSLKNVKRSQESILFSDFHFVIWAESRFLLRNKSFPFSYFPNFWSPKHNMQDGFQLCRRMEIPRSSCRAWGDKGMSPNI